MNLAWATEWFGSFRSNFDKAMDMYADDVQFEDVILAHKVSGKAALGKFFSAFNDPAFGEHVITVVEYAGNADGGAMEWTWQAKHTGDFLGVPAKGKETNVRGVSILTFKNGKIISHRDYWNAAAALRQLGAIK